MSKRGKIKRLIRKRPNMNPRKLASCSGKIRYETYAAAAVAAKKATNCHAYKCDFCPFYHKGRKRV